MRHRLWIFLLLISPTIFAEPLSIPAEQWAHPRSGEAIMQWPGLHRLIESFDRQPQANLVIHHAGGDEGVLWAEELRSWLVALGIPSARIRLEPDFGVHDRITIEVSHDGGGL
jgi:hypothetical protein